ncbi:hypothetical protein NCS57_01338500 [Fusarium keratoplasticum]|uniref:Uncharacterized protein n=1 Tax=Fusarium keratoplasticum TaxID=1328300 RepID=A0ACC0QGY0_9HYPO|nr:hypothetical protein NCS57_01338500 [Fusarium keratoplasticum]KAI8652735.1 hypothetical protein NCS57_01338500 [Fusarium keratoplasticum]KAI8653449.1 hypothetical protein NCS55_01331200 [Fusarium keratoplasticum]
MSFPQNNDITLPVESQLGNPTLQVDFSWKKLKALVSQKDKSGESVPRYVIDYNTLRSPHLVFHPAEDKSAIIGSGTLHPVSIHADYVLRGHKGTLKALRRFVTSYTHLSYNYADGPGDTPAAMTWTSSSDFKSWDFICLDENSVPVAKFSANAWAISKVGYIEFMGPKANNPDAQEEIMITGLTLFSQMVLRTSSILSLFGAIFSRPGPLDKEAAEGSRRSVEGKEWAEHQELSFPKDSKS